ncbi:MAG: HEAT repeat domain-containing protein, partial [Planctomycetota bacterium]
VRLAAVEALGTREPTPAAVQALARVLANGADKGVRGAAAQALGRPGAAANLPLLTAALNPRTPSYVQLKVVEAIEQIGGAPAQLALAAVATPPPPVPNPPPAVELTPEQKAAQVLVQNAARAALERMKNHPAPGHGSPEGVEPF